MKNLITAITCNSCSSRKIWAIAIWYYFICLSGSVYAQDKEEVEIKGVVTNEQGESLPGAIIRVKGGTHGTAATAGGQFSITVPKKSILSISFTGYIRKEIIVGNDHQSGMIVPLQLDNKGLNEVVVVGYGTQKKSDVTGSIVSIKEQSLREVPVANLSQALQGQGAGIDVQKNGGNSKPGAKPKILVRGTRSVNASNDPLFVVDGIPFNGDINDLNPDDVVSVEVLKDASATAIYGSRGANGVILVSTRRGKTGRPVITYSAYAGFVKNIGEYDVMDGPQFTNFKKWALINETPGKYTGLDDPSFYTNGSFSQEEVQGIKMGRSVDWQKLIYKSGITTNHQLGITGGSETTQYALSGGYYKETGIYSGQSFGRFSVKASVDQQLGKSVKVGLSTLNTYSVTNGENANPMGQVLRANPLVSPYDSTGALINAYVPGTANQVWNPLSNFLPGAAVETRKRSGTFTTLYAEVSLAKGLKYRFNAGAEIRNDVYGNFYASKTTYNQGTLSTSSNQTKMNIDYTLENLLIYEKTIARKHNINFTGLYSLQESALQSNTFNNNTILADFLQYFNPQYSANLTGQGKYEKWDILSYMARLNYNYDERYLLTLTMRSDGSSRLAPGNKYHVFPSVSAAWNLYKERFLSKAHALTNLKLRVGYGSVGNTAISPYQTLGALSPVTYNFGSSNVTGAYPTTVANPALTWEYTATLNAGIDIGLWDNRVTGSIDVYKQQTRSLLLPQTLPPTSGIPNAIVTNVGKTSNRGIELQLSTVNIRDARSGFTWTTNLNVFINRGKITQLANGVTRDINNNWFVGYPIGVIFDYKKQGIWQNTKEDSLIAKGYGLTVTNPGSVIGQLRLANTNGDSLINADDRVILGSNQPKWEGGITNRFSFKGFDLTIVAFVRMGGMIVSKMHQSGSFINTYQSNYNNLDVDYWTPGSGENFYPKPNHANTNTPNSSLLSYFDGSYLKIRTLSLGYSLTPAIAKRWGVGAIRIYTTAQNPFILFSPYRNKYKGIDPETAMDSGSGTNNQGALNVDTPGTWSMIFGVNVSL
ncbi:SusC/RagA family TonB-linked outer membrane protein [Chitinophaga ginsengisoli]|uniref:TonB-linked SusC/RagA family outer membrane protein n=1 Tax=Chitinophaga ginsengisoli TaxID=363837 RepID=A0A2P8GE22_9BACT|nr:TonB-dependent receptor [Chitinophaga ginsengisoli]PSL32211.1 TonB-linked SusC/RagA family outer membrane protein [Chitinophaga ginsengisoli]